jgi:replicative DNA helicase
LPRTDEALRAIPTDHEAERAVLGALLLDVEAFYKVADKLDPSAFERQSEERVCSL